MKTFRLALVVLASVLFCVGNAVGQEATESDAAAKPQRIPQQSQHDLVQSGAKQYESSIAADQTSENCKSLNISEFCDLARLDAKPCNAGGGTRTHTGFNSQRILNPLADSVSADLTESHGDIIQNPSDSPSSQAQNISNSDTDLVALINAWATLPDEAKTTILMIMKASRNA